MNFSTHIAEFEPPIPNPQKWIEKAKVLYQEIIDKKRGKVVFVVGELGSGKSSVMRSLEKFFSDIKPAPNVIAGSFYHGSYQPFISDINLDAIKAIDTIGNFAAMVSKIVSPRFAAFADFAGQLLQTGSSHIQFVKDHSGNPPKMPETPYWLLQLIRETAKEKPLVCVIDDFDETQEGFGWNNFLLGLAEEIAQSASVLFIVSVTGKAEVGEHQDKETNLEFVTRELVGRGLAEWWHLKPMSREEIEEWIPIETGFGIVSQLHSVTGGHPRWVQTLWRDWRVGGAVYFDEHRNRWEWSPDKKPGMNPFRSVFEDFLIQLLETNEPREIAEAKRILGFAALEGRIFTAEALAMALNRETDEIIDYLDDYFVESDEKPNAILREIGFVDVQIAPNQTRQVFRYAFLSDWHWQVLDRFAFTNVEKRRNSAEMIQALQIAYENEERLAARSLSSLCKIIGDKANAKHYQTIADYSMHQETMREYALSLLQIDTAHTDKFQCRQIAEFLFNAGMIMLYTYPHQEVLEVFKKAEYLETKFSDRNLKAWILYYLGNLQMYLGNMLTAKEKADVLNELSKNIGNNLIRGYSLQLIGDFYHNLGEYKEAIKYHKESLDISRKISHQSLEAGILLNLGRNYYYLSEYEQASKYYAESLEISRNISNRSIEGKVLAYFGKLYYSLKEHEKAIKYHEESLEILRDIRDRSSEAATLGMMGVSYEKLEEYEKAIKYHEESLYISREIDSRSEEGLALGNMGVVYNRIGEYEKAYDLLQQAIVILETIQSPDANVFRKWLADAETRTLASVPDSPI